jgi:hypothetical protein
MSDVLLYLRASPEVLSMWPWKLSITSKFSCLVFWQPRPKNWNSEIVHQSLWSASQKHEETVRSYLLHSFSFLRVHWGICCAFHQPPQTVQLFFTKTIFLSQTSLFALFFFIEFILLCIITYWSPLEMLFRLTPPETFTTSSLVGQASLRKW